MLCVARQTVPNTKLADKVQNALDETRMLILGAQVLLGFEYQAVFQPAYERLPPASQQLQLLGLASMLLAVAFLIAPSAFHQIVESGNDAPRVVAYTNRIASLALLPFALGIGTDVYIAVQVVVSPAAAAAAGLAATAFALVFWYGIEWLLRHSGRRQEERNMRDGNDADLSTRIKLVFTEARVVLPGAQALLGFQFAAVLTEAFGRLPRTSQYVHLVSLALIAVCIVLLMAPAAYHRIVEGGEDTDRVHRFSSAMVIGALIPLSLGITGDFYVVLVKVLDSTSLAVALAAASLVFFFVMWFGVTLSVRWRLERTPTRAGPAEA